jgi:hypothetical protein
MHNALHGGDFNLAEMKWKSTRTVVQLSSGWSNLPALPVNFTSRSESLYIRQSRALE